MCAGLTCDTIPPMRWMFLAVALAVAGCGIGFDGGEMSDDPDDYPDNKVPNRQGQYSPNAANVVQATADAGAHD